jgi:hypothetical protein
MKKPSLLIAASSTILLVTSGVNAQENPRTWSPVEIIGCNFINGAGMDDFDRAVDSWNDFMDQNEINNYAAFVLTPGFVSPESPYDIGWLGAWADSAALAGMQTWMADGGDVRDEFAEVVDCPLHQALAMNNVKPMGEAPENSLVPVEFTNCTLNQGQGGGAAHDALIRYARYLTDNGSNAGHWVMRPGPGEVPDASYSFKWVVAYPTWGDAAHDFELYFNQGGDQRSAELLGPYFSCDNSRVYHSWNVRDILEEQ